MVTYRILALPDYKYIHKLEFNSLWGWTKLMTGTLNDCKRGIENHKSHGTVEPCVYKE